MMFKKILFSVCTAGFLSACFANTDIVSQDNRNHYYSDHLVRYSAIKGSMATATIGHPFEQSQTQNTKTLIDGIYLPAHFGTIPLAPIDQTDRPQGRLVFLYDPSKPIHSRDLCEGRSVNSKSSGKTMEVQAAFCYGSQLISEAVLTLPRPKSADNAQYREGMDNLLAVLLPLRDNRTGDCPRRTGC